MPSSTLDLTCTGREVSVIRCLLSGLSNGESGGGLSVSGSGPVTIEGTSIRSCLSGGYGGGSYLSSTGNATISLSCYSNTTCGSSYSGKADMENIRSSTLSQDLNSFFETPNTGSGDYSIFPDDCSTSSHKNINVSHCKLTQYLICLSSTITSHATLDFSSFVSNTANLALNFNSQSKSASNLNIVSNTPKSSSSSLFYGWKPTSITLEDSVLISNFYSKLSSGELSISFSSCTFFNCPFTNGTNATPTTLQHSRIYFDEAMTSCLTSTKSFSEIKSKHFLGAFAHFVIVSD